jgi:hypothetical protein
MHIHEYQAKSVLKSFGVPVPNGAPAMDAEMYERWVSGLEVETGQPKGRLRKEGVKFVEVTVNGPKSWSLAAAAHPRDGDRRAGQPRQPHQRGAARVDIRRRRGRLQSDIRST